MVGQSIQTTEVATSAAKLTLLFQPQNNAF